MPDSSMLLLALAVLVVLIYVVFRAPFYLYRRGKAAEHIVAKKLVTLPPEEYITLNDLMLPTSYGTTQIDHVVLSTRGVYVIETKDYQGRTCKNLCL